MFKCDKCDREYKYISLLKKHQLNKRSCIKKDDLGNKIIEIETTINNKIKESLNTRNKCIDCNKIFLNKGNLSKHLHNNCEFIKNLVNEKNEIILQQKSLNDEKKYIQQEKELQKMRNTIVKLFKKQSNIRITNINNNNNITSNNLNININSFGKEDLSHITTEDYKKFLSGFFPGFIKFIEKIHFDKEMPSNHNICISNLKSKYMQIYDGDKWSTTEKNEILDNFILKKYNILSNKCNELEENNKISNSIVDKFLQFSKNYTDEESQKITKNDIMLMIYNNKNKIKIE
jgi:hypothetical protein